MKRNILDYFPYPTFREYQREALELIARASKDVDVLLVIAPTGFGKLPLKLTTALHYGDCVVTAPTNALLEQEQAEFPQYNYLFGQNHYEGGKAEQRRVKASFRRGQPIFCNPYTFMSHRLYRGTLIMDEGHRLVEMNRELQGVKLWRKDVGYRMNVRSVDELIGYLKNKSGKKWENAIEKLNSGDYYIERSIGQWHNNSEDVILLHPVTPKLHEVFNNKYIKRIILLSATLSTEDVHEMGIGRGKRVGKIEIPSPIPPSRRPLILDYVGKITAKSTRPLLPRIVERINKIASRYPDRKGFVHVTYEMMALLRPHLSNRFVFHRQGRDAKDRLDEWIQEDSNRIFVGAGFSEGINLKGETFAFQIIVKIFTVSLADPVMKKKADEHPSGFYWKVLAQKMQEYGRICRGPEDFGDTHVIDEMFDHLIRMCIRHDLIPKWFRDVLPKYLLDNGPSI